jgi:OmpA-OmpF porin, OOP family
MKCNMLGWFLALPVLALIWGLAVKGERGQIISDLEQRAEAALKQQDLSWARARFNVTEGRLSGAAYSEPERRQALRIVKQVWGVWDIKDETALVKKAPNYVWGAAVQNDHLLLTGYVPNESARRQILQVARQQFPGHTVRDNMRPARGAPGQDIWIGGISFGLRQLMQLKRGGRVDLNGTQLGVSGEAENIVAYRTIKGDFHRRLPNGIRLAKDQVTPPRVSPFTWSATYKANQVELAGHVPSGKLRDRIIEVAKEAFPKAAIVDKMTEATGAPADWIKAISTLLRNMAKLEVSNARIVDQSVTFDGMATKELTSERVASALQVGTPDGFRLTHKIAFREPTLPTITPFTTSIEVDGKKVTLSGYVPDERGRQRLVAAAKKHLPKLGVVDALSYANGAPAGWFTCADAGMLGLSRLDTGRAELSGAILKLSGETRDEKTATSLPAAVRAAANRACKDTIEIKIKTPPEPKLTWQALSIDNRIEFSGEVIDSAVQQALLSDAKKLFPKFKIVDNMRVNPGRSTKWPKVVRLGLGQLAKMRSGLARLDGMVLTLDGIAPDTAVATQVKSRIERGVAAGYSGQTVIQVKSDAMIWSEQEAKRKSKAASQDAERKKENAAKRAASLKEIQRRAAEAAAKALAEAEARKRKAEEAEAQRKAEAIAKQKAKEAEARRKAEALAVAARCKRELNVIAQNGEIRFEVNSNRLTPNSTSTLDKLIETYRGCPNTRLEIAGHTDSTGSDQSNQRLSQNRAEAVLGYFVGKGLPRDKFIARGYGESQPRVPNDSAANRALNRRIEFDVISN